MSMSYPSAPVMVWELAGRPHRATLGITNTPGVCAMCARHQEHTAPAKKWLENKSFTNPDHLRTHSDRVCEPCAWACTGRGMDQVRMWSIVARTDKTLPPSNPKAIFATDHLHFTSRADMRTVVDTLAHPPKGEWMVSIAESGQKHSLPYAVINHGQGRWKVRMDALDINATPEDFTHVLSHVIALRTAGHSATAIESLTPHFATLKTLKDITLWEHHANHLTPWRSSPLLHLAVFLPNKEHLDEYRNDFPTQGPDQPGHPVPVSNPRLSQHRHHRKNPLVGPGQERSGNISIIRDTLF